MPNTFLLTCEIRRIVILMSKKNSVEIKTNSFCYLPQLSSLSSRQKWGVLLCAIQKKRVFSKREGWTEVPKWNFVNPYKKKKKTSPVWGSGFAALGLFSFFGLSIYTLLQKISRVPANTIQSWWQVCQHLQEHTPFCRWEGATPEEDGGIRNSQARKGKN